MPNTETQTNIAELLVSSGAVKVNFDTPFVWTSGKKSPIYCDCRELIGNVDVRTEINHALVAEIINIADQPHAIAGTATAGIPWGAWVADKMHLPFLYVRKKPKAHGAAKQVEGCTSDKCERIFVIEDAVSTGNSSVDSVLALRREHEAAVTHVFSIFSWNTTISQKVAPENNVQFHPLTKFSHIVDALFRLGRINDVQKQELLDFHATL